MSKKATVDDLGELHGVLAKALTDKIKAGEATAPEMAVAARLLKDNGIAAELGANKGLQDLLNSLPYQDGDEDEDDVRSLQ